MTEFRYHDEARKLGEGLVDIELTPPPPRAPDEGLMRIAQGDTAFASVEARKFAAIAAVPGELQKTEVKRRLELLLQKEQQKKAARDGALARFCAEAVKEGSPLIPTVGPSAMTDGSGYEGQQSVRDEARPVGARGDSQGPAADFFAVALRQQREESQKIAASRMDKELKAGRISFKDLGYEDPDTFGGPATRKSHLQKVRNDMWDAAPVSKERAEQLYKLDEKLFNNQSLRSEKARKAGWGELSPTRGEAFSPERALSRQHAMDAATHQKFFPGAGPATFGGNVYTPKETGQWMRAIAKGDEASREGAGRALRGDMSGLPAQQGMDHTINRAVLAHEKGERSVLMGGNREQIPGAAAGKTRPVYHPHASHMGLEPILQENMLTHGRPEAQATMSWLRNRPGNPMSPGSGDDALTQRLLRQAGHRPDAPMALHGRGQRSVERLMEKNKDKYTSPLTNAMNELNDLVPAGERGRIATARKPSAVSRMGWLGRNPVLALGGAGAALGLGYGAHHYLTNRKQNQRGTRR